MAKRILHKQLQKQPIAWTEVALQASGTVLDQRLQVMFVVEQLLDLPRLQMLTQRRGKSIFNKNRRDAQRAAQPVQQAQASVQFAAL